MNEGERVTAMHAACSTSTYHINIHTNLRR